MKKYFILGIIFFTPAILLSQWSPRNTGLPEWNSQGWALDAIDGSFAVISIAPSSSTSLYKTEDGGENWVPLNIPQNVLFSDFEIIDQNNIIGCQMTPPEIWGTTDGGTTWQVLYDASTVSSFLNYIKMFDANNGIVMGDAIDDTSPAAFIKTTDGGQSWTFINNYLLGAFSGDLWRRIDFVNLNTGYFYDSKTIKLYKTTNGGSDWSIIPGIPSPSPSVVKFYDENTGMVFFHSINQIVKTTDGGQTWNTFSINNQGFGDDIEYIPGNPNKIWLATLSELFFSDDGGESWQKDFMSGTFQYGRDLEIVDNNVGWFLCESVYRNPHIDVVTEVGRQTESYPTSFHLYQNYPNPFNPSTKIKFLIAPANIPKGEAFVSLKVYDVLGNEVATLINEEKPAGNYEIEFNAINLPSGVYFYQLVAGNFVSTRKMLLLK